MNAKNSRVGLSAFWDMWLRVSCKKLAILSLRVNCRFLSSSCLSIGYSVLIRSVDGKVVPS